MAVPTVQPFKHGLREIAFIGLCITRLTAIARPELWPSQWRSFDFQLCFIFFLPDRECLGMVAEPNARL
jgi:hypothetical protein